MKILIDTSSWLALVRYYLPFDEVEVFPIFLQNKLSTNDLIVIDKVQQECSFISQGIVVESIDILKDKKNLTKTDFLIPSKKFYNQLENNFCISAQKRKLTDTQFDNAKENFLKSADAKIVLQAIELKNKENMDVVVVTEETKTSNDNKVFKKIPAICKMLDINCITLPQLIEKFDSEIKISILKLRS